MSCYYGMRRHTLNVMLLTGTAVLYHVHGYWIRAVVFNNKFTWLTCLFIAEGVGAQRAPLLKPQNVWHVWHTQKLFVPPSIRLRLMVLLAADAMNATTSSKMYSTCKWQTLVFLQLLASYGALLNDNVHNLRFSVFSICIPKPHCFAFQFFFTTSSLWGSSSPILKPSVLILRTRVLSSVSGGSWYFKSFRWAVVIGVFVLIHGW